MLNLKTSYRVAAAASSNVTTCELRNVYVCSCMLWSTAEGYSQMSKRDRMLKHPGTLIHLRLTVDKEAEVQKGFRVYLDHRRGNPVRR